jgi:hypothetical protein
MKNLIYKRKYRPIVRKSSIESRIQLFAFQLIAVLDSRDWSTGRNMFNNIIKEELEKLGDFDLVEVLYVDNVVIDVHGKVGIGIYEVSI